MSNEFYNPTGNPAQYASGLSFPMRTEFINIAAGFAKLPTLSGNANKAVVVNPGASALAVTVGTLALAGNFSTTGAFNLVLALSASVTLTMPAVNGTLATLAGTETLSNKTLVAPALGTPASGVATNLTGTASGLTVGTAVNVAGGGFVDALSIGAEDAAFNTLEAAVSFTSLGQAKVSDALYLDNPIAAPSIGGQGFKIYVDTADGKLKAKASSGLVTILANH